MQDYFEGVAWWAQAAACLRSACNLALLPVLAGSLQFLAASWCDPLAVLARVGAARISASSLSICSSLLLRHCQWGWCQSRLASQLIEHADM